MLRRAPRECDDHRVSPRLEVMGTGRSDPTKLSYLQEMCDRHDRSLCDLQGDLDNDGKLRRKLSTTAQRHRSDRVDERAQSVFVQLEYERGSRRLRDKLQSARPEVSSMKNFLEVLSRNHKNIIRILDLAGYLLL